MPQSILEILLDGGADFSLVDTVEDTYFYPPGASPLALADEMELVVFLIKRNMVELMEILLRKKYLDGTKLFMYYTSAKQSDTPYLNFIVRKQGYYDDPLEKRWSEINYSNMIKLLRKYDAKTSKELQQENNKTKGGSDGK